MPDCFFVTYAALPDLDPDDRLAVDALRERGVRVAPAVWTDRSIEWETAPLCVLRSTWDYPERYAEFANWLDTVSARTTVRNDPSLVRWNGHKFYLRDLDEAGIPIVPSAWLERDALVSLDTLLTERGWGAAVVKPAHGAGTVGVLRVADSAEGRRQGQAHLQRLLRDGDALLQPYLASVSSYPERALVFIGGRYSHAVTKQPFQQLVPAGEAGEAPVQATEKEIFVATLAMEAVPGAPLYGRVDVVRDDDNAVRVIEVELIEPTLFLSMSAGAPATFADAIVAELSGRA